VLRTGDDLLLLAVGTMVYPAMQAAQLLSEHGIDCTVFNARFIKPLDPQIIGLAQKIGRVVTLEEGTINGGFGSAVLEALAAHEVLVPVTRIGIPDAFVTHATRSELLKDLGLTGAGIAERVLQIVNKKQAKKVGV
jgi:1-deoxy-D-xylulose-5-phosphate synthase